MPAFAPGCAPGAPAPRTRGAPRGSPGTFSQQTQEDEHGRRPSHGPCQTRQGSILRGHRRRHRQGRGLAVGPRWPARTRRRHSVRSWPGVQLAGSWTSLPGGTATPIKHLVVIFDENVSFDHYFGTYPTRPTPTGPPSPPSRHPDGQRPVHARTSAGRPARCLPQPNTATASCNPMRLTHSQALTCDQDHGYTPEQKAVNDGMMNKFIQFTRAPPPAPGHPPPRTARPGWS